jgi:uncharacterized protein
LPDAPVLVILGLLVGLLLVLGEMTLALVMGNVIVEPTPRRRPVVERHVVATALVLLLVYVLPPLVEMALGARPPKEASEAGVLFAIVASFVIVAAVVPLLIATGRNRLSDFGIDLRGWRGEVRYGGLGFLVATPIVMGLLIAMSSWRGPQVEHPFLKLLANGSGPEIVGVAVAAVVAAPVTEELIFRVLFQGLLESRLRPWLAILLPAVAFAAIHGMYDAIPLLPLAIVLGVVYHVRRSYLAVVTIHAMFNATFLLLALGARELT